MKQSQITFVKAFNVLICILRDIKCNCRISVLCAVHEILEAEENLQFIHAKTALDDVRPETKEKMPISTI